MKQIIHALHWNFGPKILCSIISPSGLSSFRSVINLSSFQSATILRFYHFFNQPVIRPRNSLFNISAKTSLSFRPWNATSSTLYSMYVFVHRCTTKTYLFKDELVIFELRRNQAKNAELISRAIRGIIHLVQQVVK